ncbi:MAG: DUF6443 domain-containing protein, partial [Spirosomaceae bacterium]|nr:DUF6443 domain-containing protein [Spirosomataceae bacterium]
MVLRTTSCPLLLRGFWKFLIDDNRESAISVLLICSLFEVTIGQTTSQNFVQTKTYKQTNANPTDAKQVNTTVEYADGLGRPLQTVQAVSSPTGKDVVSFVQYDAYGRQTQQFLPFTATGAGAYQANPDGTQAGFYGSNAPALDASDTGRPWADIGFENAPLNRPVSQRAAGNLSATATTHYGTNGGEVNRYLFQPHANLYATVAQNGTHPAHTLTYVEITDESGRVSRVYQDSDGLTLLKRVYASPDVLDTYYVYDVLNRLRAVLQPEAQGRPLDANTLKHYAFLYRLDYRGRTVTKQVPGADTVQMIYDQYDRLIMTQDGVQRTAAPQRWSFTKYDAQNRPVLTGETTTPPPTNGINRGHHETRLGGAGYTLTQTDPVVSETDLLTVTFYDDYAWGVPTHLTALTTATGQRSVVQGMTTGGRTRMLPALGGTGAWLAHVTYYDAEYRPIQTLRDLHDLGPNAVERSTTTYRYDLAAVAATQHTEQLNLSTGNYTHLQTYTYDHADRLLSIKDSLNTPFGGKGAFTAAHRYTELGLLQTQWLHSA